MREGTRWPTVVGICLPAILGGFLAGRLSLPEAAEEFPTPPTASRNSGRQTRTLDSASTPKISDLSRSQHTAGIRDDDPLAKNQTPSASSDTDGESPTVAGLRRTITAESNTAQVTDSEFHGQLDAAVRAEDWPLAARLYGGRVQQLGLDHELPAKAKFIGFPTVQRFRQRRRISILAAYAKPLLAQIRRGLGGRVDEPSAEEHELTNILANDLARLTTGGTEFVFHFDQWFGDKFFCNRALDIAIERRSDWDSDSMSAVAWGLIRTRREAESTRFRAQWELEHLSSKERELRSAHVDPVRRADLQVEIALSTDPEQARGAVFDLLELERHDEAASLVRELAPRHPVEALEILGELPAERQDEILASVDEESLVAALDARQWALDDYSNDYRLSRNWADRLTRTALANVGTEDGPEFWQLVNTLQVSLAFNPLPTEAATRLQALSVFSMPVNDVEDWIDQGVRQARAVYNLGLHGLSRQWIETLHATAGQDPELEGYEQRDLAAVLGRVRHGASPREN